jgi:hypothetical protein
MGADKNSFSKELSLYPNCNSEGHTRTSGSTHKPLSRPGEQSLKGKEAKRKLARKNSSNNEEDWDLPGQPTQLTGSPWAFQSYTRSPGHKFPGQPIPSGSPGTSDQITRDSPENCLRIRPKISINGSPKELGALRRNLGEMMNTPRRGYAQKIMASNSLQLPESQILAKNTMT